VRLGFRGEREISDLIKTEGSGGGGGGDRRFPNSLQIGKGVAF
jgi:hypothetical protein